MIHKRIKKIILILLLIFLCGIFGYMIIEKWSFHESLYMTIITLTTVGFKEVKPLSYAGRYFTIFILIIGFSVILYGLGTVTAFFVEGELMGIIRRRKMEKKIKKLNKHYIICGSGLMGRHVVNEFVKTKRQFVVIEKREDEIKLLLEKFNNVLHLKGDASSDSLLIKAGIKKARGLITTFASDKENLFVVLTARSLNSNLRIVTRMVEEESEHKLYTGGANAVVCAHSIGGMRMASEMLRPSVVSFLDVMLRAKDRVLRIEEAVIEKDSKFDGITLMEANIPKKTGLIVIAIKNSITGEYIYNPHSDLKLKFKDVLIMLGKVDQVKKLKEFTSV